MVLLFVDRVDYTGSPSVFCKKVHTFCEVDRRGEGLIKILKMIQIQNCEQCFICCQTNDQNPSS